MTSERQGAATGTLHEWPPNKRVNLAGRGSRLSAQFVACSESDAAVGFSRALVAAVERWALDVGCREGASDVLIDNHVSHAVHRAPGFQETERVVFFRRPLA